MNGWKRLGVIVSVVWALWAWVYFGNRAFDHALEQHRASYSLCRDTPTDPKICTTRAKEMMDADLSAHKWEPEALALGGVAVGWLLAYVLIALFRWVRRGGF